MDRGGSGQSHVCRFRQRPSRINGGDKRSDWQTEILHGPYYVETFSGGGLPVAAWK